MRYMRINIYYKSNENLLGLVNVTIPVFVNLQFQAFLLHFGSKGSLLWMQKGAYHLLKTLSSLRNNA